MKRRNFLGSFAALPAISISAAEVYKETYVDAEGNEKLTYYKAHGDKLTILEVIIIDKERQWQRITTYRGPMAAQMGTGYMENPKAPEWEFDVEVLNVMRGV